MRSEEIYPGVVIGVVKEIDATLARIKVDFPWLSPAQRSDWASIAAPMAGGASAQTRTTTVWTDPKHP